MLNVKHFNAMIEQVGWKHAMNTSWRVANNDTYIMSLCDIYDTAEKWAIAVDNDVNSEPYFSIRQLCIERLRSYYKENG